MGGSSKQTIGYQYFSFFLLFIGNPIEKMLGINFDKRGWQTPLIDDSGNPLSVGVIEKATLYGENEGGVAGQIHARYGTSSQEVVSFYKEYMESKGLQASAYPFQSYLAFPDFYVGNSGYMKEMLLWPKRTRIRNDGRRQWYEVRGDGAVVCEIGTKSISSRDIEGKDFNFSFKVKNTDTFTRPGIENEIINEREVKVVYQYDPNSDSLIPNYYRTTDHYSRSPSYGHGPYYYYKREIDIHPDTMGLVELIIDVEMKSTDKPEIEVTQGNIVSIDDQTIETTDERGSISRNGIYRVVVRAIGGESIAIRLTVSRALDGFEGQILNSYFRLVKKPFSTLYLDENQDINPIHKIREILTDDTAMGKPESDVNDANFIKAADRIYDEGLGISWSITEKSCIDAINELCYHIESGIRVNRQTGLYEMVLFRDDWFEEDEIHTITENKIKKGSMQYEITNADEVVNQVNVNYYDRDNIKNSSFSISESGLIQTLGRVNAETLDFPYFMNMRNAEIVANWKLKILSTGVLKGSFTTGWREARKWNRYDLIKLPWSKRWAEPILVRIMNIRLGGPTSNEVSIEWVEVVPSTGMMNTTIVADAGIDKPLPPQACQYEPFELPYYLAVMALGQRKADEELAYESNFGLVGTVAEKPQENSLYAVMMTNNGDEWVRAGSIQYSATTDLDQIISETSLSFTVKNWKRIANVPAGTLIKCGRDWLGTPGEWMVFQSIDPSTGIVSVKRGALDTQPQGWGEGTKLYFCGNDVSYDQTEYISGEEVLVSALTTTPSGVLEQKGSIPIEMKARAIRPYLPANVKFNDTYFPETLIVTNNIVLTWAHRNRAQQTGGEIIGWYDGDVTVESGVTYAYELISENVVLDSQSNIAANTATILASVLKPNKPHTLKLWSMRDGYDSYQKFKHSFFAEAVSLILSANTTSNNVSGNTLAEANIIVNVDTSLSANMRFDGSNIKGKASAGSIITIEVEE
ncbi:MULTISPECIES: hypothetical protein [unclassified Acinetobacter]|uniref:hypothetical protein n=1 Tax=unclassified Acinetobacter TaxID=196816 RepID=UPI0015D1DB04|nr:MULTISPECIES: hypothetical protein [unclassified Acinetobacter]